MLEGMTGTAAASAGPRATGSALTGPDRIGTGADTGWPMVASGAPMMAAVDA